MNRTAWAAALFGVLLLLFLVFGLPALTPAKALARSPWPVGQAAAPITARSAPVAGGERRLAVDLLLGPTFAPPALVTAVWLDTAGVEVGRSLGSVPLDYRWEAQPRPDKLGNELRPRRVAAPSQGGRVVRLPDGTWDLPVPAAAASVRVEALSPSVTVAAGALTDVPTSGPTSQPPVSGDDPVPAAPLFLEAERANSASSSSIPSEALRSPDLSPYDSDHLLINAVTGTQWKFVGQSLTWEFSVDAPGARELWLNTRLAQAVNGGSFRLVRLDGQTLGASSVALIKATPGWASAPVLTLEGQPLVLPLTAGRHILELTVTNAPVAGVLTTVDTVLAAVRELGLQLRSLTGDTQDTLRDWKLDDYLPGVGDNLVAWAAELDAARAVLVAAYQSSGETREAVNLRIAAERLRLLAKERDELPYRRSRLSEGSGSVAGMLATTRGLLEVQPLDVDWLALVSPGQTPQVAEPGFLTRWQDTVRRFWLSFAPAQYNRRDTAQAGLSVWVNRPRAQAELIQQMADEELPGLGVQISLIPDEGKIILANAAGRVPDVGLGLSNYLPFELALRGAALDLRRQTGFSQLAAQYSPGAFLPFVLRDGVYAFPETQDFWLTFYRKDIYGKLGLTPPDTWQELVDQIPTLRRAGLKVYLPISGGSGFKPFFATLPFLNQAGGRLYKPDGTATELSSEASLAGFKLMADLFTLYSLPLQVPVFFEHFKSGAIPLGITNATTYVQLVSSAPELTGTWDLAPQPGIPDATGEVVRWAPGSASTAMVFAKARHPDKAWTFLQWWLSADVQTRFAQRLIATYGLTNLWFPANLEAFGRLPLPVSHRDAILAQWKWLREPPKMPGTYMVERQISDAWNKMVFNGTNAREAVDQAALGADREVLRKLTEFGWAADGKLLKPWPVPDRDTIETLLGKAP